MSGKNTRNTQNRAENATQEPAQANAAPLQFDVKIQSIKPKDNSRPEDYLRGTASVNINDAFAVRGVKICEGTKGLFVSMPSYKSGGEYKDICFPITQECRKQLNDAVLTAYEQAITQGQSSVAKHHEMQQAPQGQAMEMSGM